MIIVIMSMVEHQFRLTSLLNQLQFMLSTEKHWQHTHCTLLQRRHIREPANSGDHEAETVRDKKHRARS